MRRALSVLAVFALVACNSVLNIPEAHLRSDDLPNGPIGDDDDTGCGDNEKTCNGKCVPNDNPATGCGGTSCNACALANAASAICKNGACAVDKCNAGFGDCNNDGDDGCEVDITSDPANCSVCGHICGGRLVCGESLCKCEQSNQCGHGDADCNTDNGVCTCNGDECGVGSACDDGSGGECAFFPD